MNLKKLSKVSDSSSHYYTVDELIESLNTIGKTTPLGFDEFTIQWRQGPQDYRVDWQNFDNPKFFKTAEETAKFVAPLFNKPKIDELLKLREIATQNVEFLLKRDDELLAQGESPESPKLQKIASSISKLQAHIAEYNDELTKFGFTGQSL